MRTRAALLRRLSSLVFVSLAMPGTAPAQIPLGPDFQVNAFTTNTQRRSSVGTDLSGNFVVVWESYVQDGDLTGVFARRYDASGAPIGASEFRVNAYTTSSQYAPRVAMTPTGEFMVVWHSFGQDGSGQGVFARRFDATGTPIGLDFQVNTYVNGGQSWPAVAASASGFVAVWESSGQDGNNGGIFGQRYDASGVPQGLEFQANSHTTSLQGRPAVAMTAGGGFVVLWASLGQDGNGNGVFGQRYDGTGARVGGEFPLNIYTTSHQGPPHVASDAAGNFVVIWPSDQGGASGPDIMARRYNASGVAQGPEFRANEFTLGQQDYPGVASDPRGNFVVTWGSNPYLTDSNVFGRRFDSRGGAEGPDFPLTPTTTNIQRFPAVAADATGRFVVAWNDWDRDGAQYGIFARRFLPDVIFKDDFETGNLSAWSASATDAGDLSVSSAAALNFTTAGLRGVVDDTVGLYAEDRTPEDEGRYRARFYIDPSGFDPGEAQSHFRTRVFILFSDPPARRVAALVLRRQSGVYSLMGRARLDDNSQANTGFFTISGGPHVVELDLVRASGPDANDGSFQLWIDSVPVAFRTGLDNSLSGVDFVRLGALSVKSGASGTIHWDEFVSRRQTYIGP